MTASSNASNPRPVRIGTRGSPLALVQARLIAELLKHHSDGALEGEIVSFTTTGDKLTTERLINAGGKGLFTKEIDLAVDDGRVDIAVHSLKDVPIDLPEGQAFMAFPPREDPREGFISHTAAHPRDLPEGAIVGTASIRREAQTLAMRPDLKTCSFRGNVETRLSKLDAGEADATYLAMAGLTRLRLAHHAHPLAVTDMLPSAGQGIIAVAARPDALPDEVHAALSALSHVPTRRAALAERAFLACLDGSCRTPIAAHLFEDAGTLVLRGEVYRPDGQQRWQTSRSCAIEASDTELTSLGLEAGAEIRDAAGGSLPQYQDE